MKTRDCLYCGFTTLLYVILHTGYNGVTNWHVSQNAAVAYMNNEIKKREYLFFSSISNFGFHKTIKPGSRLLNWVWEAKKIQSVEFRQSEWCSIGHACLLTCVGMHEQSWNAIYICLIIGRFSLLFLSFGEFKFFMSHIKSLPFWAKSLWMETLHPRCPACPTFHVTLNCYAIRIDNSCSMFLSIC